MCEDYLQPPPSSTSTFITAAFPFRAAPPIRAVFFDHSLTSSKIAFFAPSFTNSLVARYVAFLFWRAKHSGTGRERREKHLTYTTKED